MGWNRFKSKLLVRYILSYLLIFLIPLITVTVIIYYNAIHSLQFEVEQSSINQLDQAKQNIDSRMKELEQIAIQISLDNTLTPYMTNHPYYGKEAIESLNKYVVNSGIIDEVFLYFHNQDVLYSSRGKMAVEVMLDYTYKFPEWDKDSFIYDMSNLKVSSLRPTESIVMKRTRENRVFAYLEPLPVGQSTKYATLMFVIEENTLKSMMESILSNFKGNSYIFDHDGNVLAKASHGQEISPENEKLLSNIELGITKLHFDNVEQSIVSVQSDYNGWNYVTALPSEQFFSRIVQVKAIIILIFAVTTVIGSIFAVLLARKQYYPIKDLLEFAKVNKTTSKEQSRQRYGHTELDQIRETLLSYQTQVDVQEPYARNQYLFTILKHGVPDRVEVQSMLEQFGIYLYDRQLFVILTAWEYKASSEHSIYQWEELSNYLTELGLPEGEATVYGVELTSINKLALIIGMKKREEPKEQVEFIVEHLYALIETRFNMLPTMGVGGIYERPEQLNQSYIEAVSALETRMVNGQGSITYFSSLSQEQEEDYWITKDMLIKLGQSLKQGNAVVAVDTIEAIFADLYGKDISIPLLRCMCYDVLNIILKTASELKLVDAIQQISTASEFDTLEQLEVKLCSLSIYICSQVEDQEETEMQSLTDEVVAYINENFCNYGLSLEGLAEKYRVSVSYLSRTIKENTGVTFSQQMWNLRMEEVKRQLLSSNDPLKDIINRVGYMDVPNFIRKFKKELGYTPGQYRKMYS
ncbi:helix-turn-helix domain-containing protein [Paenibacillus yanchengensis]|uniref:Helix-turn-helix domain-containing protein n=1 Tax=Paenibacillus yanchengensis TaxID=2035833 RepID=A0ABW4YHU1_9BACL